MKMPFSTGITDKELMGLFGRSIEDIRWLSAADSAENLDVVTYRFERASSDGNPRR